MKEARFYEYIDTALTCTLCPHYCRIKDGGVGICLARKRIGEKLYSENYGAVTALHLDPVEKKPLMKYRPGSYVLSVGTYGCNFKCGFCQNYDISQRAAGGGQLSPEDLAAKAFGLKNSGNIGIAYTYNEPTIMYEYVYDTSVIIKEKYAMDNILVTNGYINEEPLRKLLPYIDAANVDLKSFDPMFYSKQCKGDLDIVKRNLAIFNEHCHLEITTLIIGGYNDRYDELKDMCVFIASISKNIPLHLSRFYPAYKFSDVQPTPASTMYEAKKIADVYLSDVYLGNMP
jgi:pyruvate formate lyase activating enzyme